MAIRTLAEEEPLDLQELKEDDEPLFEATPAPSAPLLDVTVAGFDLGPAPSSPDSLPFVSTGAVKAIDIDSEPLLDGIPAEEEPLELQPIDSLSGDEVTSFTAEHEFGGPGSAAQSAHSPLDLLSDSAASSPRNGSLPLSPLASLPDPFEEAPEPRLSANADVDEKVRVLRTTLRIKTDAIDRGRQRFSDLQADYQELHAIAAALKVQFGHAAESSKRVTEYQAKLERTQQLVEDAEYRAKRAEAKLEATGKSGEANVAELRKAHKQVAVLEAQLAQSRVAADTERHARQALSGEVGGLRAQVADAEGKLKQTLQDSTTNRGQIDTVQEELNIAKLEHERLGSELSLAQSEIESLRSERDVLVGQQQGFDERLSQLKSLEERLENTLLEKSTLEQDLALSQQDTAELQARNQSLDGERTAAQERATVLEERIRELMAKSNDDVAELTSTKNQLAALMAEKQALQSQLQRGESAQAKLSNELTEERDALAARNRQLESQVREIQAQSRTQRAELQAKLTVAETELSTLRKDAQSAGVSAHLKEEHQVQRRKIRELEAQLDELKEATVHGGGNAELLERENAQLRDKLDALRAQLEEATRSLASQDGAGDGAQQARIRALEDELASTKRALAEADEAYQEARDAVKEATGEQSRSLVELQEEVIALKKKLVSAENAREQAAILKARVSKLEAALKARGAA